MCVLKISAVWRMGYKRLRPDKERGDPRLSWDAQGRQRAAGPVLPSGRRSRLVLVLLMSEINMLTLGSNTFLNPRLVFVKCQFHKAL